MEFITLAVLLTSYFMLFTSVVWLLVFLDNKDSLLVDPLPEREYFISAVIPAYNEGRGIVKTIRSLLAQDYPRELFEVIVVNDGSTDSTQRKCELLARRGDIKLVNKLNGGKASALNLALKHAQGELIYVCDADSYADKNSFKSLIGYFNDSMVAAVTSSMRVTRRDSFLQRIQWLEYLFNNLLRKLMSLFNSLYITPGPGSIYRKRVLEEVGGFSTETLTEDMEVAFHIQDHGYTILNSLNSMVETDTPRTFKELFKQRKRWYTGFIEDVSSYKHFLFNKEQGFLGLFLLPVNIFSIFGLIFLVVKALSDVGRELLAWLTRLKVINYDFLSLFQPLDWADLFYGFSVFSGIGFISLVISLLMINYTLKHSSDQLSFKGNYGSCLLFVGLISPLMFFFWSSSIIGRLFKKQARWVGDS